jgi:predicted phage terminase large subunit-like protein
LNPLSLNLPSLKEIRKELDTRCLNEFCKDAWGIVEPATPLVYNWHIDAICEYLQAVKEGQIKRLLINMPPRMMKSMLVTIMYPTWCWTTAPHLKFINLSYSDTLSKGHNMKRRDIIQDTWYQNNWKDVFQLKDDLNTQRKFENNHYGSMFSTSIGGTLTGEGADVIVVDDPHNPKQAESDTQREDAVEFFRTTLQTRLNNPKEGAIIVVMQRLHEMDVSGHILQYESGYEHLCLPMVAEEKMIIQMPISGLERIREKGDILHKERYGQDEIEKLRSSMGSYGFSGQMQQNPVPSGGGMFKKWWWKYWKPKGINLPPVSIKNQIGEIEYIHAVDIPDSFEEVAQSWDMNFKNNKDNDYVAGGVWAKKGADRYFLDLNMKQAEFTEALNMVRKLTDAYPKATRKLVEDKANGPAVISSLKHEISGLIEYNPGSDSKESRAFAVTPMVESGNVYIPHPALFTWVDKFINNCAKFPKCEHDDDIDQMSQMLNYWNVKKQFRVTRV